MRETLRRTLADWDRSGWFRDGVRTYPVGLGVLVGWALVEWLVTPSSIRPVETWLLWTSAAVVVGLAALGRHVARRVLARRDVLVAAREPAARTALWAYAALAALSALTLERADAYPAALVLSALAMTSPGVFLVVLDGSPPARGALRVLVAALFVPAAVVVGYITGFAAFFVSTFIGSFVFGFLAGHLVTFVPLALIGPGPERVVDGT